MSRTVLSEALKALILRQHAVLVRVSHAQKVVAGGGGGRPDLGYMGGGDQEEEMIKSPWRERLGDSKHSQGKMSYRTC